MTSARRAARPPLVRARERARLREPERRRDGLHGLASSKQLVGELATPVVDDRASGRRLRARCLALTAGGPPRPARPPPAAPAALGTLTVTLRVSHRSRQATDGR